ncbi:MAG TPA: hypothetical protein VLW49_07220 [Gaiellaceae bacterium]|nr:hypothetical protein [Gaiellaceae bacterium]
MSDEQRNDEEPEVEAHKATPKTSPMSDEPTAEGETDDEVEAHKVTPKVTPKYTA